MKQNNDYLNVKIQIEESRWNFTEEELFSLAIRKNKKRHFLFASTVIGKYLAVHPYRPLLISKLLAAAYCEEVEGKTPTELTTLLKAWKQLPDAEAFEEIKMQKFDLNEKTLFIGFAETATGLGHGVFSTFNGPCAYLHTTRAHLVDEVPELIFREEHSHAVGHNCFARELPDMATFESVVLIDDEITTGNTALNLIKALHQEAGIQSFAVLSLLDWREEQHIRNFEALEEALGIRIQCVCILKGQIETELLKEMDEIKLNNEEVDWPVKDQEHKAEQETFYETLHFELDQKVILRTLGQDQKVRKLAYLRKATGRFGLLNQENVAFENQLKALGEQLGAIRQSKQTLCLGTEEFIYIPCLTASYMGEGVRFACSARSPIVTIDQSKGPNSNYALKEALSYPSPEDLDLSIYLYNMAGQGYEEVFWFMERDVEEAFKAEISARLRKRAIKKVYFIVFD